MAFRRWEEEKGEGEIREGKVNPGCWIVIEHYGALLAFSQAARCQSLSLQAASEECAEADRRSHPPEKRAGVEGDRGVRR